MTAGIRSRVRSILDRLPGAGSPFWLALVLVLAVLLRLFRIGANSLWFDEAFSWIVARQPAWSILTRGLTPILPPLYHFLLHFWIWLGESEAVVRLLSALVGVITIPVMYVLGRDLFTRPVGLAAALLTAVLPFHVYFSQEARPYALVVFLSALMLWIFARSWRGSDPKGWVVLGLLVGLSLYVHYFVVFFLAVIHIFVAVAGYRDRHGWRGLLLSDLIACVIFGPRLPLAWTQTHQVTTNFWLPIPSPLQPVKTLDFLLFGHTSPLWLVPVALFLVLSILILVTWAAFRVHGETRRWLLLLLALVLAPILMALLLSWIVGPIYLDRSLSIVAPAYVLFLSWGLMNPPRSSPLPVLYAGLAIAVVISLGNHYLKPDPAKPPFGDVDVALKENWQEGDVVLHLHDSSYLPFRYYAPELESYLLNNDPDTWIPSYTWEWAGDRVDSLDEVVADSSRLWLVIMTHRINDRQQGLLTQVEARYEEKGKWVWPAVDGVELRLYPLR